MTYYYWDFDTDNVFLEEDENGNVIAEYTHEPDMYGELIAQERDGEVRYYNFDGQGSTRELTDENGEVTDTFIYTAFGEEVARTGTTVNPFGYNGTIGYYTNTDTADIYVRARTYEPKIGRWVSLDPLWVRQSNENPYSYVQNNPMNLSDPSGLQTVIPPGVCKGTDCGPDGIETKPGPNPDPSCSRFCKYMIVEAHEAEHRRNMGSCCDRLNRCFELAARSTANPRERIRLQNICESQWNLWLSVNRLAFEERAAVKSCASAINLVWMFCVGEMPQFPPIFSPAPLGTELHLRALASSESSTPIWDAFCGECCSDAVAQLYQCERGDPNAKIECCPFQPTGEPDRACIRLLEQLDPRT